MKSFEYQLLDFLRSKPAEETYNFLSPRGCALGQFAASLGAAGLATGFVDRSGAIRDYSEQIYRTVAQDVEALEAGCPQDWTFGAAADRLENLLQP